MSDIVHTPPAPNNEESVTPPTPTAAVDAAAGVGHPALDAGGSFSLPRIAVRQRAGKVAVFDADAHPVFEQQLGAHALVPVGQGSDARAGRRSGKRGRPRQSLTRMLATDGPITADDLALLRAWAQGLPASRSERYLRADGATGQGARAAREYLKDLLARVAAAAAQLPDESDRSLAARLLAPAAPPSAAIAAAAVLEQGAPSQPAPLAAAPLAPRRALPTLEEFAARFDADMYSEAELIELYEEEFGADTAHGAPSRLQASGAIESAPMQLPGSPAVTGVQTSMRAHASSRSAAERLAILEQLAPHLEQRPSGRALLAAWLQPDLASLLSRSLDAPTLGALAERIGERGRWWWRAVPGLGRVRAQRLCQWLAQHEEDIGVAIDASVCGQPPGASVGRAAALAASQPSQISAALAASLAPLAPVASAARPPLAPLAQLAWPAHLRGQDGVFRAAGVNTLGAADDAQALAAWVRIHVAGKAPATERVYLRALERLVLWAICERALALSSLASSDFVALREFLAAPPAHWCGAERVVKGSRAWRPLRGPLSPGAVVQVMGVVQHMWRDWHASGYLRADAAALVPARPTLHAGGQGAVQVHAGLAGLDVTRAFDQEQLAAMRAELQAMADGPARRRLRALLLLLLETGLRRAEVQGLTFGAIEPLPAGIGAPGDAQLRVLGKRGKLRLVPVKAAVIEALQAHWRDRLALARAGALPAAMLSLREQDAPLVGVLRRVREAGFTGRGDSAAAALRKVNVSGALAGASMHGILKAFFARASARMPAHSGRAAFERASAHWLRHTFAHRVLASAGEHALPAAQALLGHASIATTGEYLRASARERFAPLARMELPL